MNWKIFASGGLMLAVATCTQQVNQNLTAAATVSCALNTGAVIGTQVDAAVDTTKAAAATNTKIVNATTALCAGLATAARQSGT